MGGEKRKSTIRDVQETKYHGNMVFGFFLAIGTWAIIETKSWIKESKMFFKILLFFFGVIEGVQIGVEWYYKSVFNQQVPMWACWIIVALLMPFNILATFAIIIAGKIKWLNERGKEIMEEVYEARLD